MKRPTLLMIRTFMLRKGRLLGGTVFFLCLLIYWGIRDGYWGMTKDILFASANFAPLPMQSNKEENTKKQGKKHGDKTSTMKRGEERKEADKNSSVRLVHSIRNVIYPDPLRNPFLIRGTGDVVNINSEIGKSIEENQKMNFLNEGKNKKMVKHETINKEHSVHKEKERKMILCGVVLGDTPYALVQLGEQSIVVKTGDYIDSMRVTYIKRNEIGLEGGDVGCLRM